MAATSRELAQRIDHTLLRPEAARSQIDKLCDEALEHGFCSVCVNSCWVERCAARLGNLNSGPLVCAVAGFPLGAALSDAKSFEARRAVEQGAREVDMVVNLGALIDGDSNFVTRDIAAVVNAVKRADTRALVKVILETRALTDAQIILGCRCAKEAGADFVKTSTGFHASGGATLEHVALLRRHSGSMKVKASGGIRDLPTALAMLGAGADRLGMSAGVSVVQALSAGSDSTSTQSTAY